jgi:cold shock protein
MEELHNYNNSKMTSMDKTLIRYAAPACGFACFLGNMSHGVPGGSRTGGASVASPGMATLVKFMTNIDNGGVQPLAQVSVRGTVKWFNISKGYGFITLENGGDAFCHASALTSLGATNLPQGATIVCDLQESPRGLQVVAVHSIDTSTAQSAPPRRPRRDFAGGGFGGGFEPRDAGPGGPMVEGKVKFFNDPKGFGFIMPDDGSGDVYVHASALRRSGIVALEPDQRVRFSTRQGMKGVEVDRLETI